MITKLFKNIFIFISASYFLFAGTGYNVVNYCCNSCSDAGIEAVATSSCNDVHQHTDDDCCNNEEKQDLTCKNSNHIPLSCHLLRLNIDIPSLESILTINTPPTFFLNLFFINSIFDINNIVSTFVDAPPLPNEHLFSSGREILAKINVLLI